MALSALPWIQYSERVVGLNHPAYADTLNRGFRAALLQSGYSPDAVPFPGFSGPVYNVKAFGAVGDGVTDDTAAVQAACTAAANAGGGIAYAPNGSYLISATINVGTGTGPVCLRLGKNVLILISITNGNDVFVVANASGIIGTDVGSTGTRTGGSTIMLQTNASVGSIITNATKTGSGQSYIALEKLFIDGGTAPTTVSGAGINLEAVNGQAITRDLYVARVPGIGIRLASNANAVAGPFVLDNCWVDGQQLTGALPLSIVAVTNSLLGVSVIGGVYNGCGANDNCITIDGTGAGIDALRDIFINTYTELRANNTIGIKITDASNVVIAASETGTTAGATLTGLSINQSGTGRTKNILALGYRTSAASITGIKNNITGESLGTSSRNFPDYKFLGGGAGVATEAAIISLGGASVADIIVGQFGAGITDAESVIVPQSGRRGLVIKSLLDALLNAIDLQAGATADQTVPIRWLSHTGTPRWSIYPTSGGLWRLQDEVNSQSRIEVSPNGYFSVTHLAPGTDADAQQTANKLCMGSGAPNNSNGGNGDYYLRTDTPGTANQRLYIKSAGSWTGIL